MKSSPQIALDAPNPAPEELRAASGFFTPADSHSASYPPRIWLASASPRRSELLRALGLPFELLPNSAHEAPPTADDEAHPARYVQALARHKAQSATLETPTGFDIIIAADTIVWHDGRILNKPENEDEARQMLGRLRGQAHQVYTGVCLRVEQENQENMASKYFEAHEMTAVRFRNVDDEWIARYVATGEPMDKAGAYAAQGRGAMLVERIEGDYMNVVGLPLSRLSQMLENLGAPVQNWWI